MKSNSRCRVVAMLLLAAVLVPRVSCGNTRNGNRRMTFEKIAGYTPTNDVSDQAAIDLDQKEMQDLVLKRELPKAKVIYEQGGHSMSYARLTLIQPKSAGNYAKGSIVWGLSTNKDPITGRTMDAVKWSAGVKNVTVNVFYDRVSTNPCMVGALTVVSAAYRQNCFAEKSLIRIGQPGDSKNNSVAFNYTYSQHANNYNARTIQKLAIEAPGIFKGLPDFETFVKFYGQPDYMDRWVISAAQSSSTAFKSGLGNADFDLIVGRFGHGEALVKGSAFLIIYMYVIGKLQIAVENCRIGNKDLASLSLDEAAAYHAGSLADHPINGNHGVFTYAMANSFAPKFKTAGTTGDKDTGTAYVNYQILEHMKRMQFDIVSGTTTDCLEAAEHSKAIANLMKVPLIQSILTYAYIRGREANSDQEEMERSEVKGATYTAAILPYIHQCSPKDAAFIYDNMRVGSEDAKLNFVGVKQALERTYDCLGVNCTLVGGIWDGYVYSKDAFPCGMSATSSNEKKVGKSMGTIFGVTVALCLCAFLAVRFRRNKPWRRHRNASKEVVGTIAAVAEIS